MMKIVCMCAVGGFNVCYVYLCVLTHSPHPQVKHEHREQEYKVELSRWHHTLSSQTEEVVTKIYNVLLFPDGWMVDQRMVSLYYKPVLGKIAFDCYMWIVVMMVITSWLPHIPVFFH